MKNELSEITLQIRGLSAAVDVLRQANADGGHELTPERFDYLLYTWVTQLDNIADRLDSLDKTA